MAAIAILASSAAAATVSVNAHGQQTGSKPIYLDEDAPIESRVKDLLSRMTPDEKIDLLRETSPANERLGIDKYYHGNEALHGIIRPGTFTVFPQAIALAASWDSDLLHTVATAISDEARACWNELDQGRKQTAKYSDVLTFWSPTVNMARDPRWGRTPETYGEDPYLTGRMGTAFVTGLQGDDPRYLKVVSTPKHFAANNKEKGRMSANADISEKDLREYYLAPYEACIKEGHAQSIMASYNAINGIPSCCNPWLLTKVLRDDWGFDGYVVSDCGETYDVSLKVRNTGRRDGDQIVKVFARLPEYEGKAPIRELKGFQRVYVPKGKTVEVHIPVRKSDLRYWSERKSCFIHPEGMPEFTVE